MVVLGLLRLLHGRRDGLGDVGFVGTQVARSNLCLVHGEAVHLIHVRFEGLLEWILSRTLVVKLLSMLDHGVRYVLRQKIRIDNLLGVVHLSSELLNVLSKDLDDALLGVLSLVH